MPESQIITSLTRRARPDFTRRPGAIKPVRDRVDTPIPPHVFAQLTSLDDGVSLLFALEPAEQEREYGAQWDDAGVAQASPQFLEYRQTNPERRTIKAYIDGYGRRGGIANSIEGELATLKHFTERVRGKVRAHKCLYTHGEQRFRCVVESVSAPVKRIAQGGGALQAYEVTITLKEIPGAAGPG